jgi:predicted transcriptional regulator
LIVQDIVSALKLEVIAGTDGLQRTVTGGYASDLLSCVMAAAKEGNVWVTLQAHPNVIAVADLLGLACVIITEGKRPDAETLARANEKGIPTLLTTEGTFVVVGRLVQLGVGGLI